jgi:hypothetical protein
MTEHEEDNEDCDCEQCLIERAETYWEDSRDRYD